MTSIPFLDCHQILMKALVSALIVLLAVGCSSIQHKYAKTTTAQLQLKHNQIVEYLGTEQKGFEFKFGPPAFMMMQGNPREDKISPFVVSAWTAAKEGVGARERT